MMTKQDYYKTLGVEKNADEASIKKAYRKLAKKYHPDMNADNSQAADKFKEITEAYNVLSDQEKKKLYDEFGFAGLQEGFSADAAREATRGGYGGGFGGFSQDAYQNSYTYDSFGGDFSEDMFADMFQDFFTQSQGGRRRGQSQQTRRGQDIEAELTIEFEEAVLGCEKSFALRDPHTNQVQNLSVKIPAGIDTGKTVRLRGQGTSGYHGGASGDVLLKIQVKKSREFQRKGDHIYSTIRIPFATAVLGGKTRVHTLYGDVECTIPEGTQAGSKIRLKGKGAPIMKKPNQQGDHYVTVEIQVPKHLSPEAKKKLREWAAMR